MIRVWGSYACNNSTSYRLIARFPDAATARATAAELAEFFAAQTGPDVYPYPGLETLARTYGFGWEDEGMGEASPELYTEDATLLVYQPYGLGLGPGVPAFLADRGGIAEPETTARVEIAVLIRGTISDELEVALDQIATIDGAAAAPWAEVAIHDVLVYRDARTTGLCCRLEPSELAGLRGWLAGFEQVVIELAPVRTRERMMALCRARCSACGGALEYLDPRLDDIETPQLLCRPCGGFYELATFEVT